MPADGRTIAPGPKRLREAYLAGLRPYSPWLSCGVNCLALAFFIHNFGHKVMDGWSSWFKAVVWGSHEFSQLWSLWLGMLAMALVLILVGTWISGSFGVVQRRQQQAFAGIQYTNNGLHFLVLAMAISLLIMWAFLDVIAGAARSVDASPEAVGTLWRVWLVRGLSICGLSFLLASGLHLWLSRRLLWLALHQTPTEFRATLQGRSKA